MHLQLLHKILRKTGKTVGKAALFVRLTQIMNELLKEESHNITLTIQNVTDFFQIVKGTGTLKRKKFVPFLSDEEKRVEWCNEIQLMMKQCNDSY